MFKLYLKKKKRSPSQEATAGLRLHILEPKLDPDWCLPCLDLLFLAEKQKGKSEKGVKQGQSGNGMEERSQGRGRGG